MSITAQDVENISDEDSRYAAQQSALVVFFKAKAYSFYDEAHQPPRTITDKLVYKPVSEGISKLVQSNCVSKVSGWLIDENVVECAEFKEGNSGRSLAARTSNGKACIIRIPKDPDSGERNRIDHEAATRPLWSIQSSRTRMAIDYGKQRIEVLPFVRVTGVTDTLSPLESSQYILMTMYNLVGLECASGVKNDLGILPDGTPLPVDPDILKFVGRPTSTAENFHRLREVLDSVRYSQMKPVAWIKDNGISAQDTFFGPDYLSTPLKPVQNPGVPRMDAKLIRELGL